MLGQTEESKMEKFVDTMPTIIQIHLITCKTWAKTTKKVKELEHIIRKCDPPAAALPNLTKGTAVPSLYLHIAHSDDKKETDIPQPFKRARPKQSKPRGGGKGQQSQQKPKNPPVQVQDDQYHYEDTNNYYHNKIIEVNLEDLTEAKIQVNFSEVKIHMAKVNAIKMHIKANIKTMVTKAIEVDIITHVEISNRVIIMANLEAEAMVMAEVIALATVTAGPIIKEMLTTNIISLWS